MTEKKVEGLSMSEIESLVSENKEDGRVKAVLQKLGQFFDIMGLDQFTNLVRVLCATIWYFNSLGETRVKLEVSKRVGGIFNGNRTMGVQ